MTEETPVLENNLVKWFSKLGVRNHSSAGFKGANIGEIRKLKIPVPEGFVVTTKAYDSFLEDAEIDEKINSFLEQIDLGNKEQLENYVGEMKNMILKAKFSKDLEEEILESYEYLGADKLEIEKGSALDILNNAAESIFVAVRSSVPFTSERTAGLREQDTYLNVKGKQELLGHVKRCFASLFNVNTVRRYLEKDGDLKDFKIAVVVQKMVEGDKSGVVYSRDSSEHIIVKGIWGLGEGMNLKEIHPDKYVMNQELEIIDQKLEEKKFGVMRDAGGNLRRAELTPERSAHSSLSISEIQRLGDLAQKIEEHFEKPQEIEFSVGRDVYIVQTKDLGVVQEEPVIEEESEEEKKEEEKELVKVEEKVAIPESMADIERVEKLNKTKLKLLANSSNFVEDYKKTGLKKVGLFKIEQIISESGKHPEYFLKNNYVNEYENLIFDGIRRLTEDFERVWIRTSDFLSDEFGDLEGAPKIDERNPFLGLHGIRYGLKNSDILEAELRAFKRADPMGKKVGVLIPGVTSVVEVQEVRDLLSDLNFEPKVGIVLETPAAVQLIKDFADAKVDCVLIHLDNLIQHLLAIDFSNKEVKNMYKGMHPALKYQLEYVLRVCRRREIETSVFGNAIHEDMLLRFLIQKEVGSICIEADDAKKFSESIFNLEKELFEGTDKEPRQYESQKSKEEYLEEVPKTMDDLKVLEESEKAEIPKSEDEEDEEGETTQEDNLEQKEKIDDIVEDIDESIEAIEEEKEEYLSEHPEEEFDNDVEDFSDEEGENNEEEKDPLGIF